MLFIVAVIAVVLIVQQVGSGHSLGLSGGRAERLTPEIARSVIMQWSDSRAFKPAWCPDVFRYEDEDKMDTCFWLQESGYAKIHAYTFCVKVELTEEGRSFVSTDGELYEFNVARRQITDISVARENEKYLRDNDTEEVIVTWHWEPLNQAAAKLPIDAEYTFFGWTGPPSNHKREFKQRFYFQRIDGRWQALESEFRDPTPPLRPIVSWAPRCDRP